MLTAQWDTAYMVTTLILGSIMALCLIAIIGGLAWEAFRDYTDGGGFGVGIVAAVVFIIALVIMMVNLFPYSDKYHRYVPVSGTVERVSSRFLSDGQGTNQKFAVVINGQTYGCNDTRCSLLKPGSEITLMCEPQYQWNATAGYDCNWGKDGLNR